LGSLELTEKLADDSFSFDWVLKHM
jgi:hypothetical protein